MPEYDVLQLRSEWHIKANEYVLLIFHVSNHLKRNTCASTNDCDHIFSQLIVRRKNGMSFAGKDPSSDLEDSIISND